MEALEPRQLLNAENNPPVGVNDSYSLLENDTLSITSPGVLSNDNDPENSALTAIHYSGPGYGTLTLNIDGSFVYTPNSGYVGSDSFTYQAYDGSLASGLITVSLTVDEVPPPTVVDAIDDAFATDEDTALWVSAPGVLGNDTGESFSATLVNQAALGYVTMNGDGSFSYLPATDYFGPDSFTYQLAEGETATVSLTVNPVNDPAGWHWQRCSESQGCATGLPVSCGAFDHKLQLRSKGYFGKTGRRKSSWIHCRSARLVKALDLLANGFCIERFLLGAGMAQNIVCTSQRVARKFYTQTFPEANWDLNFDQASTSCKNGPWASNGQVPPAPASTHWQASGTP